MDVDVDLISNFRRCVLRPRGLFLNNVAAVSCSVNGVMSGGVGMVIW